KSYTTGSFTQKALDNVSISFRDNEFVAILGPSGSGKTTMLNIVGGLDHYDSGDLVIEGTSTNEYKDRDWDAYRNNRVGFVFQSYNLIPHQTVLANVELALTLSGVSREERRQRAVEALERVGLADHIDKKPAQMSGGQMQRVAIARALINDPEILLADEPTGALDSKTSVQIMDLLTEIADDRLVVMVTHNPELAEQYATRIVNLADGVVQSDTDPYDPTPEEVAAAHAKPSRRTRMSFLTALSLSANNLMTKKGRTIMTAIAGSIGIIGIAAILALANGVNNYIKSVEEDTLSVYPLQILSTGFDMTSMFVGMGGDDGGDESGTENASGPFGASTNEAGSNNDKLEESHMMTRMFASIGNNDLASLKAYFDSGDSGIEQYANNIFYESAVTPQIFDSNTENGARQINPDTTFASLGIGSTSSSNSIVSMSMSTDVFSEMPTHDPIVEAQYDVVRGHWPESGNELVLVLSQSGRISDFMSYTLGLRDPNELKEMVRKFANEEEVSPPDTDIDVSYDDIVGMKLKLVNATSYYKRNDENNVWVDKTDDKEYMKQLVNDGEDLVIAGVVRPKEDANAVALSSGIYYTPALVEHIVNVAASSQIVKDQLANPKTDVFSGRSFDEEASDNSGSFDMSSLFTIDGDAMSAAFQVDPSAFNLSGMDFSQLDMSNIDLSGLDLSGLDLSGIDASGLPEIDLSGIGSSMPQMSISDIAALFPELDEAAITRIVAGLDVKYTDDGAAMNQAITGIAQGYFIWAANPGNAGKTISDYVQSDPQAQALLQAAAASVDTEDLQSQLTRAIAEALGTSESGLQSVVAQRIAGYYAEALGTAMQEQISTAMQTYMQQVMTQYMGQITSALQTQVAGAMGQSMAQISSALESAMSGMNSAFSFDESAFANAFKFEMSQEELAELMTSMMRVEEHSYDNNLKKLGYADFAKPNEISIYPKDFESKEKIIDILDSYNDRMRATDEDKVISYTDIVGTLMRSVTTIVDMISMVLIAFVAISLIVSSIMIGVITYISVLERKKEIGILRAIGASKGDISRVFNAETVIEGLIAGLLGVGVTALGCIPANIIVYQLFDVPDVALLPPVAAVVLVAISVFLTFIAGLIPSGSASRKDPVEALRSE
ncbi:MAG: ATP-binding cassette domain-containing protein, partial [Eggerthellaceae bacterium]|nr:ATP-binding cassette domain-containing protein [Eggerthellaceae bacterium]